MKLNGDAYDGQGGTSAWVHQANQPALLFMVDGQLHRVDGDGWNGHVLTPRSRALLAALLDLAQTRLLALDIPGQPVPLSGPQGGATP